jgi:hypothetical protein
MTIHLSSIVDLEKCMPGPYIARGYGKQKDVVGDGHCVTLVKAFSGAPAASLWREGEKLDQTSIMRLAPGTVIATFFDGRYPSRPHGNHAAIFVGPVAGGIKVFDQWKERSPSIRVLMFGRDPSVGVAQRPEAYSVVE